MAKQYFKPGNMLYPLPAVMVSCQSVSYTHLTLPTILLV